MYRRLNCRQKTCCRIWRKIHQLLSSGSNSPGYLDIKHYLPIGSWIDAGVISPTRNRNRRYIWHRKA
jgi:hypothetical protein